MLASFRGVSLALCLLLVAAAFRLYVARYALLTQEHGLFTGVRYVDQNIVIPGLLFVIAALLLGAALAAANIRIGRVRNLAFAYFAPSEYPTHRMLQELLQLESSDATAEDLATRLLPKTKPEDGPGETDGLGSGPGGTPR